MMFIGKITAFSVLVLFFYTISCPGLTAQVRSAQCAGTFYPGDPDRLRTLIGELNRRAGSTGLPLPSSKPLKALILPHAGYIYSGLTAAHAVRVIDGRKFNKVVIVGPDHRIGISGAAVSGAAAFSTPLGTVKVNRDDVKYCLNSSGCMELPVHRDREHSLEVILPFLQVLIDDFSIVPVLLGPCNIGRTAGVIDRLVGDESLLVISSDLSHYLAYEEAVRKDRQTIQKILSLESGEIAGAQNSACGAYPIEITIELAKRHRWQPVLLHYANSGDTAGDKDAVVGYAAIAFYGDTFMTLNEDTGGTLTHEQGQVLVRLARKTLMDKFGVPSKRQDAETLEIDILDKALNAHCGTFVTLKMDNELRGCIGNLVSNDSLVNGVRNNAMNAAFNDPRFSPLTREEFDRVDIEVSVLTAPQPLDYSDGEDLIAKLRVNVDGVIIRKDYSSATFLPQVWEQLPKPDDFLSYLCLKAGLSADEWRKSKLDVMTYQVQYFDEEK